jgi:hypothetical protein
MLRHIISVSLAMITCASLIPTKAKAATLTMEPVGSLQRNRGDLIQFELALDPDDGKEVEFRRIILTFVDRNELSYLDILDPISPFERFTTKTILGRLLFRVREPVKDEKGDLQVAVDYREPPSNSLPKVDVIGGPFYDVQPVPEPLTMFGAAAALGYGAILKRKYSKKTEV